MNFKRAIINPMYGSPRKCWLCGRIIDKDIVSCHFFDFDVKKVWLRLFHTHTGCARRAGLLKDGKRWKVNQAAFMLFWCKRFKIADDKGEVFGWDYGALSEPWPHCEGLTEAEAAEWDAWRAKAKIN